MISLKSILLLNSVLIYFCCFSISIFSQDEPEAKPKTESENNSTNVTEKKRDCFQETRSYRREFF